MSTRHVALALLACFLASCTKQDAEHVMPVTWESMAKGYTVENSRPIFGSGRHVRMSEDSADGRLFDFVLSVGPLNDWSDAKARVTRFWGWGAATEAPERLRAAEHVQEMSLILDGKSVHFSEAAYVDLIDLRVGSGVRPLWKDGPRFLLYLEGADAGESYRVKFTIENYLIVKREVWKGEFPELGPHVTSGK